MTRLGWSGSNKARRPSPRKRPRTLLIRYGEYEFSTGWCPNQHLPATTPNGKQGRTVWLGPLVLVFRWGSS